MKPPAHRRHNISDRTRTLLEPHLPGRKGNWGGITEDNRTFINAVLDHAHRRTMARSAAGLW